MDVAATLDSLKNVYATVDGVAHTGAVTNALEQLLATLIDEETALRRLRAAVQSGTVRRSLLEYSDCMRSINRADAADTTERLARLERIVEEYRATTERKLLQRAIKLWRRAEAQQKLVNLEKQREHLN